MMPPRFSRKTGNSFPLLSCKRVLAHRRAEYANTPHNGFRHFLGVLASAIWGRAGEQIVKLLKVVFWPDSTSAMLIRTCAMLIGHVQCYFALSDLMNSAKP